uniref:Uncharacterized protein n=1 Tax=Anguilla anguilla TaxID=7936 RepID=A0A0E9RSC6_ANGAN
MSKSILLLTEQAPGSFETKYCTSWDLTHRFCHLR